MIQAKQKICLRREKNREFTFKYGGLVVFIRHDSAEKLGFRVRDKIMASTGVFVRVVCALKRFLQFPTNIMHESDLKNASTRPQLTAR